MAEETRDEAIVLRVQPWQTVDKYVFCFTRNYGKRRFVAYGARYEKNVKGRLLQPFAELELELTAGQRIDRLKNCELRRLPEGYDITQMAYAAVAAELTYVFTEDGQPQEELYLLLQSTLRAIAKRNPRIVVLSFGIKLLQLVGLAPEVECCINCGKELLDNVAEGLYFSPEQGGVSCSSCGTAAALKPNFQADTQRLWLWLAKLDYANPAPMTIKGSALMELERNLYQFILFQTDKPLRSLEFLQQMKL